MTTAPRQTIHIHNRAHRAFASQPLTTGLPWPQGALRPGDALVVHDEHGHDVPAAFTPLNTWPDGSVQWTLLDTALDLSPSAHLGLTIQPTPGATGKPTPKPPTNAAWAKIEGDTARIGNGLVELVVSSKPGELVRSWTANTRAFLVANGLDATFLNEDGTPYSLKAGPRTLTIEHANPLRCVLRLDGKHATPGSAPAPAAAPGSKPTSATPFLDYFLRFEVRAGRSDVKITYCFRNRELPTPGIKVKSWFLEAQTAIAPGATRCFTANTRTRHYLTEPMRVREDPHIVTSDTGDIEHYEQTHKEKATADCFVANPEVLHDPVEDKPWWLRDPKFRLQAGGSKCVWPYLAILDGTQGTGPGALASVERMTSLHPKSLTVAGSTFRVGLWPEWAGTLAITQGAGRSHVVNLAPLAPGVSDVDIQTQYLSWEFGGIHTHIPSISPVEVTPDLAHVRRTGVFAIDKLPAYDPAAHFAFERKVLDAFIGISYGQLGAVDQVAQWPAAGFWHFGDQGLGNNEEMHNLVYFENYFRSGNAGCLDYALAGTTHMLEVDHCAFSTDAYQSGGQVAHTVNHNDGTAYPSHMWFTEYLFAYVLTGDREFLEGAKRACANLLHWIDDPVGFQIISADQREAGQPLINLTWCYHFTKAPRYLDGCWKIVREYFMASAKKYGRMLDGKPFVNPVKVCSYGDYAAWEGMYWLWEITHDAELKAFMLRELEWRLKPELMGTHGFHRVTDYNPAAYAFYLTGDRTWLDRVAYPFWHAFRAARWPLGWVHCMYFTKLAFDYQIVTDRDVLVQ